LVGFIIPWLALRLIIFCEKSQSEFESGNNEVECDLTDLLLKHHGQMEIRSLAY